MSESGKSVDGHLCRGVKFRPYGMLLCSLCADMPQPSGDADARAVVALRELFALIEDGLLVRNTTNDGHMPSYLAESTRLVKALAVAKDILGPPEATKETP